MKLGFAAKQVDLMILCVSFVSYTILVNNQQIGPIYPKWGLCQGDPLSPYLFILCAEGLSSLIAQAENCGFVHGIKICKEAPTISPLLFADDSVFFCCATVAEYSMLKHIFFTYETVSRQAINYSKSGVLFSGNVPMDMQSNLSNVLSIVEVLNTRRYL